MRGSLAWEERRPPRSGPSVSFYGTPLFSPSMPHRCFNSGDKLRRIKCSGPGTAGPAAGEGGGAPSERPGRKTEGASNAFHPELRVPARPARLSLMTSATSTSSDWPLTMAAAGEG